jgi:hypothetical protein
MKSNTKYNEYATVTVKNCGFFPCLAKSLIAMGDKLSQVKSSP